MNQLDGRLLWMLVIIWQHLILMYRIFNRVKCGKMRMKVRKIYSSFWKKIDNFKYVDNKMLNGLDDESHLLHKDRSTANEVDWSHVPTKRKKPTKKKVSLLNLSFCIIYFISRRKKTNNKRNNSSSSNSLRQLHNNNYNSNLNKIFNRIIVKN
jgi:hypothetical protein